MHLLQGSSAPLWLGMGGILYLAGGSTFSSHTAKQVWKHPACLQACSGVLVQNMQFINDDISEQ